MRDGLPGLALLADQEQLPAWLAKLFPLNELDASGSVNRRCRSTELRILESSGGPLSARGRFHSTPDSTLGAFLVTVSDLEPLAAGLALTPQGKSVDLLPGEHWLDENLARLDAQAATVRARPCLASPERCQ